MSKENNPTHIVITAFKNRWRNGLKFIKKIAQTLDMEKFDDDQIEAFVADPVLLVTFETNEVEEVPEFDQGKLIAVLANIPDAGKTQKGDPKLDYLTNMLGFKVDRSQVDAAIEEMTKN